MKNSKYMDRALKHPDPRFAQVLEKLGHSRSDMVADPDQKKTKLQSKVPVPKKVIVPASTPVSMNVGEQEPTDDQQRLTNLRSEYYKVIGRRPFNGWSEAELADRIKKAQA